MKSINELLGVSESYKAPDKVMEILFNEDMKKDTFNKFLENFNHDVSKDWFFDYFQDEHGDRVKLKQDFTPKTISDVLGGMAEPNRIQGVVYEPSAGTGGNIVRTWFKDTRKKSTLTYSPSEIIWWCEEISDRSIPFLLFNLMIRGMNAVVVHGDTLTRKAKKIYTTVNEKDWHLDFSVLKDMTDNKHLIEMLEVEVE